MSDNKKAIVRYLALDKCFRDFHARYDFQKLWDKCNEALSDSAMSVGRSQLYKDIDFMMSENGYKAPITKYRDGQKVFYRYSDRDFSIQNQPLSDDEAQQLRTMIVTLSRFRGLPSYGWIEEVVSNLEYRFGLQGKKEAIVSFEQNARLSGLDKLPVVLDAAANHQVLEIMYRNYKNADNDLFFTLHPYHVKQYNNRWFLIGLEHYHQHGKLTVVALDRIVKIDAVDDIEFVPNTTIDFEHYFDDVVGVTIPDENVPIEHIVLQFSPGRFPYVTSKPIHRSQQIVSEEDKTISIDVRPNKELDSRIMSYCPDICVVSPESYRLKFIDMIKQSLEKNSPVHTSWTNPL